MILARAKLTGALDSADLLGRIGSLKRQETVLLQQLQAEVRSVGGWRATQPTEVDGVQDASHPMS
jgi:hypothetical protein